MDTLFPPVLLLLQESDNVQQTIVPSTNYDQTSRESRSWYSLWQDSQTMFFISFSRCFLAHRRTKSLTIRLCRRTKRSNLSYFWQWLLAFYVVTSQVWWNLTKQRRTRRNRSKQQQLAGEGTIAVSMPSLTAGEHVKRKIKQLCLRLNVVKCGRRTFHPFSCVDGKRFFLSFT